MNITTWLGTAWAAIKGAFSFGTTAKLSIVDYLIGKANDYFANVDWIVSHVQKAYSSLVWICDKLDYYKAFIPAPWANHYNYVQESLYAMRDTLADGRIDREEIERVANNVKTAYEGWNK